MGIVTYLDEIVHFCAVPYNRISGNTTIHGSQCSDFYIIAQDDTPAGFKFAEAAIFGALEITCIPADDSA